VKTLVAAVVVALLPLSGEARLGDSYKELKRRYGQPMDSATNPKEADSAQYVFYWEQYVITATIQDGFSVAEEFARRNHRDFTLDEVRYLLNESTPGVSWTQLNGSTWKQRDRVATWSGKTLVVQEKQRAR
jgi:hypothetical protein